MINGNHGQGTHSTKMGADKLPQNLSAQAKVCDFDENRLHWASGSPCLVKSTTTKLRLPGPQGNQIIQKDVD